LTIGLLTAGVFDNTHLVGILQITQNLTAVQQTLNQLTIARMLRGSVLIGVAARILAPIDHITRTARHILEGDS